MTVVLLLWLCLSLLSRCCDGVLTDEKNLLRDLTAVQNCVDEVVIGWKLVPPDPESFIFVQYVVTYYEKKSARKPKPYPKQTMYFTERDNTSISLGYLNLCASYLIEVYVYFQGGTPEKVTLDLERPCPMDNKNFMPQNLRVLEAKDSSVSLDWDDPEVVIPSNKVKYEINYTFTETNEKKTLKSYSSKNVSIEMLPCSKYNVELVAIYNDFNSTLKTQLDTPFAGPKSFYFTTEVVSHDVVKWFIVPSAEGCPATSFIISATGRSKWDDTHEEMYPHTTTQRNLTLTGLYPGTEYTFQVTAQNDYGKTKSVNKNATTLDFQPTTPLNVEAFRASSETVRVKWTPPEKSYGTIKNYWVEIYNDDVSTLFRASPNANQLAVHSFTSKDYSSDMGALVWVENQRFNSTKSSKVRFQSVPKHIPKDPYDYY